MGNKNSGSIIFYGHTVKIDPNTISTVNIGFNPPILHGNFGTIKIIDMKNCPLNFGCSLVMVGDKNEIMDILRKAGLKS